MRALILALMLFAPIANADGNTFAHIGGAAGITGGMYLVLTGFSGRDVAYRPLLLGVSMGWSALSITAVELMDANGGYLNGHDMKTGIITTIVTGGIIYALDIHGVEPAPIKNGVGFVWRFK